MSAGFLTGILMTKYLKATQVITVKAVHFNLYNLLIILVLFIGSFLGVSNDYLLLCLFGIFLYLFCFTT